MIRFGKKPYIYLFFAEQANWEAKKPYILNPFRRAGRLLGRKPYILSLFRLWEALNRSPTDIELEGLGGSLMEPRGLKNGRAGLGGPQ